MTFALLAAPFALAELPARPTAKAAATAAPASNSHPLWSELRPVQQQALAPLASSWNSISEPQKRKWLKVSKTYGRLPAAEQATLHSRMNEWVLLSPEQRAQARLNFATSKELSNKLTPEEKKAKWTSYQALSPQEKARLAAAAPKLPGAAPAVRPVARQKLAAVPHSAASQPAKSAPRFEHRTPVPPAAAAPPSALHGE